MTRLTTVFALLTLALLLVAVPGHAYAGYRIAHNDLSPLDVRRNCERCVKHSDGTLTCVEFPRYTGGEEYGGSWWYWDGALWTEKGEQWDYNAVSEEWEPMDGTPNIPVSCRSFFLTSDDTVLMGSGGVVYEADKGLGTITTTEVAFENDIWNFTEDKNGAIWAGEYANNSVDILRKKDGGSWEMIVQIPNIFGLGGDPIDFNNITSTDLYARHVHHIKYCPFRDALYVAFGEGDNLGGADENCTSSGMLRLPGSALDDDAVDITAASFDLIASCGDLISSEQGLEQLCYTAFTTDENYVCASMDIHNDTYTVGTDVTENNRAIVCWEDTGTSTRTEIQNSFFVAQEATENRDPDDTLTLGQWAHYDKHTKAMVFGHVSAGDNADMRIVVIKDGVVEYSSNSGDYKDKWAPYVGEYSYYYPDQGVLLGADGGGWNAFRRLMAVSVIEDETAYVSADGEDYCPGSYNCPTSSFDRLDLKAASTVKASGSLSSMAFPWGGSSLHGGTYSGGASAPTLSREADFEEETLSDYDFKHPNTVATDTIVKSGNRSCLIPQSRYIGYDSSNFADTFLLEFDVYLEGAAQNGQLWMKISSSDTGDNQFYIQATDNGFTLSLTDRIGGTAKGTRDEFECDRWYNFKILMETQDGADSLKLWVDDKLQMTTSGEHEYNDTDFGSTYIYGRTTGGNTYIDNLKIMQGTRIDPLGALTIQGAGSTVRYGIVDGATGDGILDVGSGNTIHNMTIYDVAGDGIESTDAVIRNVIFEDIEGQEDINDLGSVTASNNYGDDDGDPLFAGAAEGDFRLQAASPAIDAGFSNATIPGSTATDYAGTVFTDAEGLMLSGYGDAPDIGAYEYAFPAATGALGPVWPGLEEAPGLWPGLE